MHCGVDCSVACSVACRFSAKQSNNPGSWLVCSSYPLQGFKGSPVQDPGALGFTGVLLGFTGFYWVLLGHAGQQTKRTRTTDNNGQRTHRHGDIDIGYRHGQFWFTRRMGKFNNTTRPVRFSDTFVP